MQDINLLPKRTFLQRFSVFIIFIIVLVGGGGFAYLYLETGFIEDETGRIQREMTYLQHDISQLNKRLEDVRAVKDEAEKTHDILQQKTNRLNWSSIIDAIAKPGEDISLIETNYSDMAIHLQITFDSYEQLQQYEQSLLRSSAFESVDIHRTTLDTAINGQRVYSGQISIQLQR